MNFQHQMNQELKKSQLIDSLTQELEAIRNNHQKYISLHDNYSRLCKKLQKLKDDKTSGQAQQRSRNDHSLKVTQELRVEIDLLKRNLRSLTIIGQQMSDEQISFKDLCLKREHDVVATKNYMLELLKQESQLKNQQRHLKQVIRQLQEDRDRAIFCLRERENQFKELQSYKRSMEQSRNQLNSKFEQSQGIISSVQESINFQQQKSKECDLLIVQIQNKVNYLGQELSNVQREINEIISIKDNLHCKSNHFVDCLNNQRSKLSQQNNSLNLLQKNYKDYCLIISSIHQQIIHLGSENQTLLRANQNIVADIDSSVTHLETMGRQNQMLMESLDKLSMQDSSIINLLCRKERIDVKRIMTIQTQKKLMNTLK